MSSRQHRAKLFFDLDKAKEFAAEVEKMAEHVTIRAGKSTNKYPILRHSPTAGDIFTSNEDRFETVLQGPFYRIEKVNRPTSSQNSYHVRYTFYKPQGASHADMLQAQREIETYLNQKYTELGPDTGVSRA